MIRTRLFWMAVMSVVVLAGVVSLSQAVPECTATGVVCKIQDCGFFSDRITQATPGGMPRIPFSINDVIYTDGECGDRWASNWLGQCPTITGVGGGPRTSQDCDVN